MIDFWSIIMGMSEKLKRFEIRLTILTINFLYYFDWTDRFYET